MSIVSRLAATFIVLILVVSCHSRPDKTDKFEFSDRRFYYTSEYYFGSGPVNSDYTRIYINFVDKNNVQKEFVASGDYLVIDKVLNLRNNHAVLCKVGGNVDRHNKFATINFGDKALNMITEIRKC